MASQSKVRKRVATLTMLARFLVGRAVAYEGISYAFPSFRLLFKSWSINVPGSHSRDETQLLHFVTGGLSEINEERFY